MAKKYELVLEENDVQVVLEGLGEIPVKRGMAVYGKLAQQIRAQQMKEQGGMDAATPPPPLETRED